MNRRQPRAGSNGRPVQRVRQAHVEWVSARLSTRDRQIIASVEQLRLASSSQLERLHFSDLAVSVRGRVRRRVLARLVSWRVLVTLERRIGGVRAGSAGLVFALDTAGAQLALLDVAPVVRRPREPSVALLGHTLAASELYVSLVERSRFQPFSVEIFQTEPRCWWPNDAGGWLKPDAYLRLSTADVSDHWWVEVDKGTEHVPTVRRKLLAYLDFVARGGLGPRDIVPRVLVTTPTDARCTAITEVVAHLPEAKGLFHVVTEVSAPDYVIKVLRE